MACSCNILTGKMCDGCREMVDFEIDMKLPDSMLPQEPETD